MKHLIKNCFLIHILLLSACSKRPRQKRLPPHLAAVEQAVVSQEDGSLKRKPRILVFTSNGGGGHTSAVSALHAHLDDTHEIIAINLLRDILFPLDPLENYIGHGWNGEELYNWLLKRGSPILANTLCSVGKWRTRSLRLSIEQLINEAVEYYKPDILLSVMPIFNGAFARVAESKDLPIVMVTVDFDTVNYINDITNPTYKKLYYCIPVNEAQVLQVPLNIHIPQEKIRIVGFPVRASFLRTYNPAELKRQWNIPTDKPVIMLSMGAVGSKTTYHYARKICRMDIPLHVIVCLGRNEHLASRLSKLKWRPNITTSFVGFTDKIAELMAISDLLITKPGPTTICEALAMKLPLLVDCTQRGLFWERMNIEFVLSHKFGSEVRSIREIAPLIKRYLGTDGEIIATKQRFNYFEMPDFERNIKRLLGEIVESSDLK